jgi:hypothetical protein
MMTISGCHRVRCLQRPPLAAALTRPDDHSSALQSEESDSDSFT